MSSPAKAFIQPTAPTLNTWVGYHPNGIVLTMPANMLNRFNRAVVPMFLMQFPTHAPRFSLHNAVANRFSWAIGIANTFGVTAMYLGPQQKVITSFPAVYHTGSLRPTYGQIWPRGLNGI